MMNYELVPCKVSEYNKSLTLGMWSKMTRNPTGFMTEHLILIDGQDRVVLKKIYHRADKEKGIRAYWECYKLPEIPKHSYLYGV